MAACGYENFEFLDRLLDPLKRYFEVHTLPEKCPNTEFFWSVFSRIRTEYGEIIVQMRENTDQKKLRIWTLFTQ